MADTPHPADWAEYHAHMEDEDEITRLRAENVRLREVLEDAGPRITALVAQYIYSTCPSVLGRAATRGEIERALPGILVPLLHDIAREALETTDDD